MKRQLITTVISYMLSILFMYAAVAKTMDYQIFVADIAKSPLLGNFNNKVIAPLLLGLEYLTAIGLQFKATVKLSFYLSSFLMLMFTLYLSTLYFFYTDIPCSCGGILGKMPYPVHIIFNLVFTLVSFTGAFLVNSYSKSISSNQTVPVLP
jgi:hypothetical protein